MKKPQLDPASKKLLNKLCKDSAIDLTRLGLDRGLIRDPEKEEQQRQARIERRQLFTELKKKIDNLSGL